MSRRKELELWQCIVRNISKPFQALLIVDTLVLVLTKNQRILDRLAYTEVIKT